MIIQLLNVSHCQWRWPPAERRIKLQKLGLELSNMTEHVTVLHCVGGRAGFQCGALGQNPCSRFLFSFRHSGTSQRELNRSEWALTPDFCENQIKTSGPSLWSRCPADGSSLLKELEHFFFFIVSEKKERKKKYWLSFHTAAVGTAGKFSFVWYLQSSSKLEVRHMWRKSALMVRLLLDSLGSDSSGTLFPRSLFTATLGASLWSALTGHCLKRHRGKLPRSVQ